MKTIDRGEAIKMLCDEVLQSLDAESRASHLLNWWWIDEDDEEFWMLSKSLQAKMMTMEEPPDDVDHAEYDELIFIALCAAYKGVTNGFIAELLDAAGLGVYVVEGEVELLEACPCCGYRTLSARGEYDICGLCWWEDNGVSEVDQYSGPNHMTLGEAQRRFVERSDGALLNKWRR